MPSAWSKVELEGQPITFDRAAHSVKPVGDAAELAVGWDLTESLRREQVLDTKLQLELRDRRALLRSAAAGFGGGYWASTMGRVALVLE